MKMNSSKLMSGILCLSVLLLFTRPAALFAVAPPEVPVKGMVTMVDLGAGACIPCKLMAPILEKLEKQYAGRAAVVFLDVWKDQAPARRFGIRTIPTQIFFDKDGKEVYRHEGFLSEEEIVRRFNDMGVKLKG
ncbi:MAG: thioredoxin domain-containing protein [Deltaproteobacteria bacterium]|nr:thioredoxin domain-containing protein [Deltaproteobacteria bacterium]